MRPNLQVEMGTDLQTIVKDFAEGVKLADHRRPQAVNARTKKLFRPGIGPHSEKKT